MTRHPLSETGAKWGIPIILVVFGLVWLFNAYKLGRLSRKAVTLLLVGGLLVLLALLLFTL